MQITSSEVLHTMIIALSRAEVHALNDVKDLL